MARALTALLSLTLLAALAGAAAPPEVPPYRRQLSRDDEARIDALMKQLQRAGDEERFAEAEKAARAIAELRQRAQGESHWEAREARLLLEHVRRLGKLSPAQRQALRRADQQVDQGRALLTKGRHDQALLLYQQALKARLAVLGEEHHVTAESYNTVAVGLQARGQSAKVLPLLEKALAVRRKALGEFHPATAQSYNNVASCLQAQGKYAEALPLFEKALAVCRKVVGEEHLSTATCYNGLAFCLHEQGQHDRALPLFERALAVCRKAAGEEHPLTARGYNSLAACLDGLGQHARALPLHHKALAVCRKVLGEQHPHTATCCNNFAGCLSSQGQYARAIPLYEKALAIRLEVLGEQHAETAISYHNLASCLNDQEKRALALPLFEKALAIRLEVLGEQHPDTATSYNGLAFCLNAQGQHARAILLYEKALGVWRKGLGEDHPYTATSYNNVAFCHQEQGQYARALPLYRKALNIFRTVQGDEHHATAACVNNVAFCLQDQGQLAEAVLLWQASLPGQEAARFHLADTGFGRARASSSRPSAHLALAWGLARLGQPVNAYRHAEIGLARGLLDDLASAGADAPQITALSARLKALDGRLLPLLGRPDLSGEQRRLRDEQLAQRRRVVSELARLGAAVSARQVLPLERIQEQLPADGALVFWLDDGTPSLACVLRREGPPVWVALPGGDSALPRRLYQKLSDPSSTSAQRDKLLEAFRRQRLTPLQAHLGARGTLPAVRRLFVVPMGAMALVPVEVLAPEYTVSYVPSGSMLARLLERPRPPSGGGLLALGDPVFAAPESKPPARGLLLMAVQPGGGAARAGLSAGDVLLQWGKQPLGTIDDLKKALSQGAAPVRYWREGREAKTPPWPAGPLGIRVDPLPAPLAVRRWRERNTPVVQRDTGHKALPGTAREVEALARLVKGATTLLGSQASEQELDRLRKAGQLKRYRLLHFATHGEVDEGDPDRCRLILAQDNLPNPRKLPPGQKAYTGELTVRTIREKWELGADLVVLSACSTALGQHTRGDGLLGFAQAFLSRGARSVVLSLWQVDDESTALLMVRFYQNLLGKRDGLKAPMGKAEALAEAKEWLRNLSAREVKAEVERLPRGKAEKPVPLRREARPFAHPYYWAAFVLMGDPC